MGNCFSCLRSKSTTRPTTRFNEDENIDDVSDKRITGNVYAREYYFASVPTTNILTIKKLIFFFFD